MRNHGLFSLKSAVSAMQPGYMLLNEMPVLSWYLLCNSDTVIMLQTLESLYAFAPKNGLPSAMAMGLVAPS